VNNFEFDAIGCIVFVVNGQLVSDNNPDTHARRVPVFQRLLHIRVETLQLLCDVCSLGPRTNAKSRRCKDKQGEASRIQKRREAKLAFTNHEDTPVRVSRGDFAHAFYCLSPIWQGIPTPFFIDRDSKNGGVDHLKSRECSWKRAAQTGSRVVVVDPHNSLRNSEGDRQVD
jgi:hypothetical protein